MFRAEEIRSDLICYEEVLRQRRLHKTELLDFSGRAADKALKHWKCSREGGLMTFWGPGTSDYMEFFSSYSGTSLKFRLRWSLLQPGGPHASSVYVPLLLWICSVVQQRYALLLPWGSPGAASGQHGPLPSAASWTPPPDRQHKHSHYLQD